MPKGGARPGAGRPRKEGELREMRCLRATEAEWDLIRRFSHILKYKDRDACEKFVKEREELSAVSF